MFVRDQVVVGIRVSRISGDKFFDEVGQTVRIRIRDEGITGDIALRHSTVSQGDTHHPSALLFVVGKTVIVRVQLGTRLRRLHAGVFAAIARDARGIGVAVIVVSACSTAVESSGPVGTVSQAGAPEGRPGEQCACRVNQKLLSGELAAEGIQHVDRGHPVGQLALRECRQLDRVRVFRYEPGRYHRQRTGFRLNALLHDKVVRGIRRAGPHALAERHHHGGVARGNRPDHTRRPPVGWRYTLEIT